MYKENDKTLMNKTEDDTNKWKDNIVLESILLKWPYHPKTPLDSVQSLSNYQWHFFTELEPKKSQFVWEYKRLQRAEAILRKMMLRKSSSLTLDYTTKLQSSNQNSIGTKTDI